MERDNWIEKVLNSTNGMTTVQPSDDLLSKIQRKINQQNKVSPKAVWLAAASIAVLIAVNVTVLKAKTKGKTESTAAYLQSTMNQSNQLY